MYLSELACSQCFQRNLLNAVHSLSIVALLHFFTLLCIGFQNFISRITEHIFNILCFALQLKVRCVRIYLRSISEKKNNVPKSGVCSNLKHSIKPKGVNKHFGFIVILVALSPQCCLPSKEATIFSFEVLGVTQDWSRVNCPWNGFSSDWATEMELLQSQTPQ